MVAELVSRLAQQLAMVDQVVVQFQIQLQKELELLVKDMRVVTVLLLLLGLEAAVVVLAS